MRRSRASIVLGRATNAERARLEGLILDPGLDLEHP
jgi:hypothetical protein